MNVKLYCNKGKYIFPRYWRFGTLENQMVKYFWFMFFLIVVNKIQE